MGEEPAAIREQIEQTRERMGETVDALGYKADVPSRAKESLAGKVDTLKAKVSGAGSQVAEATPDGDELKQGAKRAAGVAQENPLGLAIGATAVGFLTGMLMPSTKIEDERLGPVAEQVKDQARHTGQEALEHGKQIAQETAETAAQKAQEAVAEVKDKAQESAQGHAEELSDSAKESAEQAQGAARDAVSG
jgi:gas vesicle protein